MIKEIEAEKPTEQEPGKESPAPRCSALVHRDEVVNWAVYRWYDEVANRPLGDIHRRTLDDTWRQVIARLGGDDEALIGPRHDDLVSSPND